MTKLGTSQAVVRCTLVVTGEVVGPIVAACQIRIELSCQVTEFAVLTAKDKGTRDSVKVEVA